MISCNASEQATEVADFQVFQALFQTRTGDPLLTIERRGGNQGHGREAAGTKARKKKKSPEDA
jgi:hypothetical protein